MTERYKFVLPVLNSVSCHEALRVSQERRITIEAVHAENRLNILLAHFNTDAIAVEKFVELLKARDAVEVAIAIGEMQIFEFESKISEMESFKTDYWGKRPEVHQGCNTGQLLNAYLNSFAIGLAREDYKEWKSARLRDLEAAEKTVEDFAAKNEIRSGLQPVVSQASKNIKA